MKVFNLRIQMVYLLADEKDKFNSYQFFVLQNQLAVLLFLYDSFIEENKKEKQNEK